MARDSHKYRAYVGPPEKYDLMSANQFNLLTLLGLREEHYFLDIGCGSLRGGRLFIPYLLPGRYFGMEPNRWLVEDGITSELGVDLQRIKRPTFSYDENFTLTVFNQQFDFILAQSVFSHAAALQISQCLSEARKVMKPGAIFAANFRLGEENYAGTEWVYPGGTKYTLEKMQSLVEEQQLCCRLIQWSHPNNLRWIVITQPGDAVPDLTDYTRAVALESRLKSLENRLSELRGRPLVRLALKIGSLFPQKGRRQA